MEEWKEREHGCFSGSVRSLASEKKHFVTVQFIKTRPSTVEHLLKAPLLVQRPLYVEHTGSRHTVSVVGSVSYLFIKGVFYLQQDHTL